jgi:multiple sugar transport system ATP-binding protein
MAHIRIRGLTKSFPAAGDSRSHTALSALDLDVSDGELLVLVGPSGCGKSTALRMIAGLEEPTSGSIEVDDKSLDGVPPQQRDVAMVFQGYALYPHLTVAENMAFPLKMRGQSAADRNARVQEIAELVGLADKLGRLPAELSGGERQRVAMGRAIVRSPSVFLFDEPLSNLDAKLRAELRVELASLVRRLGTTAIYVTHDQAEAMTMGDRVAVLNAGELQQVAPPRDIYEAPANAFVAGFVGTPAMNLLTAASDGGQVSAAGLRAATPAWLDCSAVRLGFRPEHVQLGDGGGEGDLAGTATVIASEPLGAETFVYLKAEDHDLRVRVSGFGGPDVGSEVRLCVPEERLLWFDEESGARLVPEAT